MKIKEAKIKVEAAEDVKETETLTEEEQEEQDEKKAKKEFWTRLVGYFLFGLVAPCGFVIWRFNLFTKTDQIAMGGWGIIIILIFVLFISSTLKWVYKGMKFSLVKQCLSGFCRVILPLLAVFLIAYSIKDSIDLLIQALGMIIACECVAIPLNPLPQWYYKTKGTEMEGVIDTAIDKYFTRKKKEENDK